MNTQTFQKRVGLGQAGVGLVEVLIAAAIMSIVALGFADLMTNMQLGNNNVKFRSDGDVLSQEMRQVLANSSACTKTFKGEKLVNEVDRNFTGKVLDADGNDKYVITNTYGDESVKLSGFKFTNVKVDSPNKKATYELMAILNSKKASAGAQNVARRINISADLDANDKVVTCIASIASVPASGGAASDIWQRIGAEDIFYSPGNVGISTNSPSTKLEVVGNTASPLFRMRNTMHGVNTTFETDSGQVLLNTNAGFGIATGLRATPSISITKNRGWVGVNTASPSALFDIQDTDPPAHNLFEINVADNNPADSALIIRGPASGGSTILYNFRKDGDVGMGVASPSAPLHVHRPSRTMGNFPYGSGLANAFIRLTEGSPTPRGLYMDGNSIIADNGLVFGTISGGIMFGSGNSKQMSLRENGRVNIGNIIAIPLSLLHIRAVPGSPAEVRLDSGGTTTGTNSTTTLTQNGDSLVIRTDDHVKIMPTNNVGIGVTMPTDKLHVAGDIRANGDMKVTGCFKPPSGAPLGTCGSDARLKSEVRPFTLGLNVLENMRLRSFKYNGLGGEVESDSDQLGVIAQELEPFAPSLIGSKMVKMHKTDAEKTQIKTVNYSAFLFVVINAVKEFVAKWRDDSAALHAEIDQLKLRNAQLTAYLCDKDPAAAICADH